MGPISEADLIKRLRKFGFEGPFVGGKHPLMKKGQLKITIPNKHGKDIGVPLQQRIIKCAGISKEDWENCE
jgi:predicted RNA binding protein YcfA (HicA-like mRNA interferase family)